MSELSDHYVQGVILRSAVHIHIIRPHQYDCREDVHVLDEQERSRSRALRFAQDKELFNVSHIFLRKILSHYAPVKPEEWVFTHNKQGKPAISNPGFEDLNFNLSHTQGLVACAVCRDRELGVDVEYIREMSDLDSLARHILTDAEQSTFSGNTRDSERLRDFFRYWTLKEAYVKVCGGGLSIPLKSISFGPVEDDPHSYRLSTLSTDTHDSGSMWMLTYPVDNEHLLALSVRRKDREAPPALSLINWQNSPCPEALLFNVLPE